MLRHGKNYTGNNRFYGFAIDLLEEVARISKFSYIVDLNPDGVYGVKNPVTGEWNGIVKQLMAHVRQTLFFPNPPVVCIYWFIKNSNTEIELAKISYILLKHNQIYCLIFNSEYFI